ncbi:LLM class flavin-dependent oxidoreductase [Vagococcus sp. BWB3-3]|uniref:LLM class flavin-dependent oxidoreductase n=1 Tax=Vagococcus allomyrinae TaxID=2794353 RepID=A0A940PCA7_9ENTE|nr:LLM class flavin-dependent oxidoreductase [Vagococcus allomyrinae]MBP1041912.1 LLM class flavin-dependent oxidoreductase [Vagococcus allomyrinae]
MKLSVLDQLPVTEGQTAVGAIEKTIELAQLADQLGFERMWFAEHHGGASYASSAPEIITAYVAAATKRLRLGTGGTMMMHYSPLKMAEVFKTLSALAPGRIDFGVGRAPGGDMRSAKALASGNQVKHDDMYGKLLTTLELIRDQRPADLIYRETLASPVNVRLPEAWLLGSSGNSAMEAGRMGINYSFAQFFMGGMSKEIFETYRNFFEPSYYAEKPAINVAYMATVAETQEEADYEAGPVEIHRLMLTKGGKLDFLTPEGAQDVKRRLTEMDKIKLTEDRKYRHLVGTPKIVGDQISQEGELFGFDEAMIVSITHSQAKRLQTYRLLAKELL